MHNETTNSTHQDQTNLLVCEYTRNLIKHCPGKPAQTLQHETTTEQRPLDHAFTSGSLPSDFFGQPLLTPYVPSLVDVMLRGVADLTTPPRDVWALPPCVDSSRDARRSFRVDHV